MVELKLGRYLCALAVTAPSAEGITRRRARYRDQKLSCPRGNRRRAIRWRLGC